ncbi:DUF58 domain-containing protein [Kocuria tytonis]|uniref:DUF58 domain-containing protein n=1 Tax=Kocuria tytonis TaxID=2054280 RepID=A0A495A453_9MICC|nr:DUF58 domain-containing protein [Kocuria tytonis]RKQ34152.1 DUF58 domain-containing protein [Kocuria tytonis]
MRAAAPTARVDSRAKFTTRGWCFLAAAVLSLAAATWLGRKDVLALSLFLGMVPLLSSLAMWLVKPRVLLKRSVDPPLVTLGDAAQVALRVRRRPSPGARTSALASGSGSTTVPRAAVDVHETVDPLLGRDQDVSVPVSGAPVTYTVRPRRRGIHELGPATVRVSDPFGVVTELLDVAERTSLHVAPDPEELTEHGAATARETGRDPSRRAQPQPGPDNVTTREYRHGDPMRRVHWAASAKHDRLMVRQEDPRSTRRAVVVLDTVEQHWPGERVWAGTLASTEEFEWAVTATASVLEHLTRRETVVHALDDQGRALPRGDARAAQLRDTAVNDAVATEVVHGLSRAALVERPEPEAAHDPLARRLEQEGLVHPVLLLTGRLSAAAARRYVQATTVSASCAVVMVLSPPLVRPDSADVFESAGWSVVLVSRWTDVDAAWLAVTGGGSLLAPPPPKPGAPQLSMDDVMGRTRRRTTA